MTSSTDPAAIEGLKNTFKPENRGELGRLQPLETAMATIARDKLVLVATVWLLLLTFVAVVGPIINPYDPTKQNIRLHLSPPAWQIPGSSEHLLGTDYLGRDLLSRMISGARVSATVGLIVIACACCFGTAMGLFSGYFGGKVDAVLMRIVDLQCAFPGMLLALTVITVLGTGIRTLIVVLMINNWAIYARMTRGNLLRLKESAFIEAARVVGCTDRRIMFVQILPHLISPLITLATLELGGIILAEAGLSFLGLGIQPPESSWGLMVAEGRDYMANAWWVVTFPGLAIAATVLSINVLANWLREMTDPLLQRGQR